MLGFYQKEVDSIYKILAAILHLGDVDFEILEEEYCCIKNKEVHDIGKILFF